MQALHVFSRPSLAYCQPYQQAQLPFHRHCRLRPPAAAAATAAVTRRPCTAALLQQPARCRQAAAARRAAGRARRQASCMAASACFTGTPLQRGSTNGTRLRCSQWLENSAQTDVAAPLEQCYRMWEDRQRIPQWMPWIRSVEVQPNDPALSKWLLSTRQFNRDWQISWLARNLTPVRNQKIHWRSVPGSLAAPIEVANRGVIRFYPVSADACSVKLTISYEVPDVLAPFAGALTPIVESILRTDMQRFAKLAASRQYA